jgi:hypothetical protein
MWSFTEILSIALYATTFGFFFGFGVFSAIYLFGFLFGLLDDHIYI